MNPAVPLACEKFKRSLFEADVKLNPQRPPSARALVDLDKLDKIRSQLTPVQFEAFRGYIIHRDRESQKFAEMMAAMEQ